MSAMVSFGAPVFLNPDALDYIFSPCNANSVAEAIMDEWNNRHVHCYWQAGCPLQYWTWLIIRQRFDFTHNHLIRWTNGLTRYAIRTRVAQLSTHDLRESPVSDDQILLSTRGNYCRSENVSNPSDRSIFRRSPTPFYTHKLQLHRKSETMYVFTGDPVTLGTTSWSSFGIVRRDRLWPD